MHRKASIKAAASSFIIAMTMVGCSSAALDRPGIVSKGASGKYATTAMAALAKQDAVHAVPAAESAVAGDPQNAGYRALLGRAYLLAGRYSSAETSFSDAMTLGNSDARTIVSLALVQIALGKGAQAQTLLTTHRDILPVADYGLAIALAGDATGGVQALSAAARNPSADAKTRQNLAYAYALAGMWQEAKMMASLDLAPADASRRVSDWALTSTPDSAPQRIAMLTGVAPKPDNGLPVRLALAAPAPDAAPVRLAEVSPVAVEPAPAPAAIAAPAIATIVPTLTGVQFAAPSPIVQQLPHQNRQRRASYSERVIRAPSTPMRVAAFLPSSRNASSAQPVSGGAFAVQIGAYDSAAVAKEKFDALAHRNATIARFPALQTSATVNGRLYYRAAIGGFADAASAGDLCRTLRAQGSSCFVRAAEGAATPAPNAPAKPKLTASVAPAKGKQIASR